MKIENGVKKIEGVTSCSVNFVTKTLTMETATGQVENIVSKAKEKVKTLEPHIRVIEKNKSATGASHSEDTHGHEDDHGHSHDHGNENTKRMLIRLLFGTAIAPVGLLSSFSGYLEFALFVVAYIVIGGDIVLQAKNIVRGQVLMKTSL